MRVFVLAGMLALSACSSTPVTLSGKEFSSFSQIDFETVRFRRPEGALFDPEAKSAKVRVDSAGNVISDAPKELKSFDCESSEVFFSRLKLAAIRSCLTSLHPREGSDSLTVEWKLNKESQPTLVLRDPEDAPECVRSLLGDIPVPREILFTAEEGETGVAAYTSRLALESGTLLGWEVPRGKVRLRVKFPLVKVLKSDRELERLLRGWVLSIFRGAGAEGNHFQGRFLPTRFALKCLGIPESSEHGEGKIPPGQSPWPTSSGGSDRGLDVDGTPSLR